MIKRNIFNVERLREVRFLCVIGQTPKNILKQNFLRGFQNSNKNLKILKLGINFTHLFLIF